MARKDNKNRVLEKGESQRKDGTYMFRYTNLSGQRKCVYSKNLNDLRKKKKSILRDIEDGIGDGGDTLTLDELFNMYMATKNIANSTRTNHIDMWNHRIRGETLGNKVIADVKKSDILRFYQSLQREGLRYQTIKYYHSILSPCLQMAVDDDMIRKNPCNNCIERFTADDSRERNALTIGQQDELEWYVKNHKVYSMHYPMIVFMIETAVRCGEMIGLTWQDVDLKNRTICIDHQLAYKKKNGSYQLYASEPKTKSGVRSIPLTNRAIKALYQQKEQQFSRGWRTNVKIDGYTDFVFSTKNKRPVMPSAVNNALYNIVNNHNKDSTREPLPHISAHILRHTGCTRMSERGIEPKVLQYIMGHSSISVTMDVYNHVSMERCRDEMRKMERMKVV